MTDKGAIRVGNRVVFKNGVTGQVVDMHPDGNPYVQLTHGAKIHAQASWCTVIAATKIADLVVGDRVEVQPGAAHAGKTGTVTARVTGPQGVTVQFPSSMLKTYFGDKSLQLISPTPPKVKPLPSAKNLYMRNGLLNERGRLVALTVLKNICGTYLKTPDGREIHRDTFMQYIVEEPDGVLARLAPDKDVIEVRSPRWPAATWIGFTGELWESAAAILPPANTLGVVRKNNDGCTTCYSCGAPTEQRALLTSVCTVCTQCGK